MSDGMIGWLIVGIVVLLAAALLRARDYHRQIALQRLERKLDVLVKDLHLEGRVWPEPSARVLAELRDGKRVAAIKLYRDENAEIDLLQARLALEEFAGDERARATTHLARIERKLDAVLQEFGVSDRVELRVSDDVRALVRSGNRIAAIRLIRQENEGLGLAEARAVVDELR